MENEKKNKKPKAKSQKSEKQSKSALKQRTIEDHVRELRPIDDVMFHKLMEGDDGKAVCEELLQTVLNDDALSVLSVEPQKDLKNLRGRSVRLDAFCRLGNGTLCNVEVQKANDDDHFRRVRYNEACVTSNFTKTRTKFNAIPDVIMIYISDFQLFNDNRTIYHCATFCEENGQKIENGLQEIYVTTKGTDDGTLIKELMKCMLSENVDHPSFPKLSKRMKHLKSREGGFNDMCKIVEDLGKEYANDMIRESVKNLLESGMSPEKVIAVLKNIPKELILEVYEEMKEADN